MHYYTYITVFFFFLKTYNAGHSVLWKYFFSSFAVNNGSFSETMYFVSKISMGFMFAFTCLQISYLSAHFVRKVTLT